MSSKEEATIDGKPISSLRVIDLKSELEQRGLSKSGSKKELMDRLKKHLELELSRDSSVNDEEHVPNLSLNDDGNLATNDFVREYLTNQQAVYQKEKEAKKVYEEERAKESESAGDTTQDEDDTESKAKESEPPSASESPKPRPPEHHTPMHPKKRELSRIASEEAAEEQEKRKSRKLAQQIEGDLATDEGSEVMATSQELKVSDASSSQKKEEAKSVTSQEESKKARHESPSKASKEDRVSKEEGPDKEETDEKNENKEESRKLKRLSKSTEGSEDRSESKEKKESPKKESRKERRDSSRSENKEKDVEERRKSREESREDREERRRRHEEQKEVKDRAELSKHDDKEKRHRRSTEDEASERREDERSRDDSKSRKLKRERPGELYVPPARRASDVKSKEPEKSKDQKHNRSKPDETAAPLEPVVEPQKESSQSESKQTLRQEEGELELNYGDIEDSDEDKSDKEEQKDKEVKEESKVKQEAGNDSRGEKRGSETVADVEVEPYNKLKRPHQPRPASPPPLRRPKKETLEKLGAFQQDASEVKEKTTPVEPIEIDWDNLNFRKLKRFWGDKPADSSEEGPSPPKRALTALTSKTAITSDALQSWYPDVEIQPEEEVTIDKTAVEAEPDLILTPEPVTETVLLQNRNRRVVTEAEEEEKPEVEGPALPEKQKTDAPATERPVPAPRKAILVPSDRPVSPARSPVSSVLSVLNLTRPFTVGQLKELLGRTGQLVEGAFWIDKVKSRCLVEYTSDEEAVATRDALHGVKWPASNPKLLFVDYSTKENLEKHISGIEERVENPPQPRPRQSFKEEQEEKKEVKGVRTEAEASKFATLARLWDVGKVFEEYDQEMKERQMRGREEERPSYQRQRRGYEEEEKWDYERDRVAKKGSGEMLDVLFRKTKTKPSLYFLPLTEEQIAEKEARRQKILEERRAALTGANEKSSPPRRRRSPTPEKRRRSPARNGDRRSRSPPRKSQSPPRKRSPQRHRRRSSSQPRRR